MLRRLSFPKGQKSASLPLRFRRGLLHSRDVRPAFHSNCDRRQALPPYQLPAQQCQRQEGQAIASEEFRAQVKRMEYFRGNKRGNSTHICSTTARPKPRARLKLRTETQLA